MPTPVEVEQGEDVEELGAGRRRPHGRGRIGRREDRGYRRSVGARIASLAAPSEVLVSHTVQGLVSGSGLMFEDAGEHELKGVPDRWHLYRARE
jgi:class 3 adenylate cyclase